MCLCMLMCEAHRHGISYFLTFLEWFFGVPYLTFAGMVFLWCYVCHQTQYGQCCFQCVKATRASICCFSCMFKLPLLDISRFIISIPQTIIFIFLYIVNKKTSKPPAWKVRLETRWAEGDIKTYHEWGSYLLKMLPILSITLFFSILYFQPSLVSLDLATIVF